MELIDRLNSLLELGHRLQKLDSNVFQKVVSQASTQNPWFTKRNIELSFEGLLSYLDEIKFNSWINRYEIQKKTPQNIGLVMAGNIPMVGIHDLICTIMSGHKAIVKLSSQDEIIIPFITRELCKIDPKFENQLVFVEKLTGIDAVIATGSDNTSRYFDFYFGKYPNIIRRNRTSVAILNNLEGNEDLMNLGQDIFSYFGLGCRNVSKIFVPQDYRIEELLKHFTEYVTLIDHNKYCNNYYYNKSILLVDNTKFIDGEFTLLQQSENLVSPISMIYYDYYEDIGQLKAHLKQIDHKIQCMVTNTKEIRNAIPFGSAQRPEIWEYADNIDTMKFLTSL